MLAQISVHPIGEQESLGRYIAEVIRYIKEESDKRGLKYNLHSMATEIEGPNDEVWAVLKGAHDTMKLYTNRVYTSILIDDRKNRDGEIAHKKDRIEKILLESQSNKNRH